MLANNKFPLFLSVCIVGIVVYLFLVHKPGQKVGYVSIKELYNGFEMKKQMEQKFLRTKASRDKIMDSLKFELNILLKKIDSEKEKNPNTIEEFKKKKENFYQTKSSFEEENTKLSQQFDEQILTQLNQYVKEYGKQAHFNLLLGNDGNGTLMYATDDLDHTKEVLEFINEKYNGTK
jgi:outer membrane protein